MKLDAGRGVCGLMLSIVGYFTPIGPLLLCILVFIAIDFVTGCWASYRRSKRQHREWYFSSYAAWRTVEKLLFSLGTVMLAFVLSRHVIGFIPKSELLPNLCTGFICGVEFWSFLENAGDISEAKIFRIIKRYTINKVHEFDEDVTKAIDEDKNRQ